MESLLLEMSNLNEMMVLVEIVVGVDDVDREKFVVGWVWEALSMEVVGLL